MIWYLPENMKTGDKIKIKDNLVSSLMTKVNVSQFENAKDCARELVYRTLYDSENLISTFEKGITILQKEEFNVPIYLCSYLNKFSSDTVLYIIRQLDDYNDEYIYLYDVHSSKILKVIN